MQLHSNVRIHNAYLSYYHNYGHDIWLHLSLLFSKYFRNLFWHKLHKQHTFGKQMIEKNLHEIAAPKRHRRKVLDPARRVCQLRCQYYSKRTSRRRTAAADPSEYGDFYKIYLITKKSASRKVRKLFSYTTRRRR